MRIYKNISYKTDKGTIHLMQALSKPQISVEEYRQTFYELGKALGLLLNSKTGGNYGNTMLACASEDTDWLAHGVLDSISCENLSLSVFWNERIKLNDKGLEYSPIIKSYSEPIENCKTLIMVKSIISTSCVVKTQLTRMLDELKPQDIYIVAPVMYKDSQKSLENEFPLSISKKFNYVTFAVDTVKDSLNRIIPGVGGMVYPKLGLGDIHEKNKYIPQLVKERIG